MIDKAFIEAIIRPELNRTDGVDVLKDINSALFKNTANEISKVLETTYDFEQTGQVGVWALDVLEITGRLDQLMTVVIHRIYTGNYESIRSRTKGTDVLAAICYEAAFATAMIAKIIPYLYKGENVDKLLTLAKQLLPLYGVQFATNIRIPLEQYTTDQMILDDNYPLNGVQVIKSGVLLAECPKVARERNDIERVQADANLCYMPALTMGVAITEFTRGFNQALQQIIIGDKAFLVMHSENIKSLISSFLNALVYVSTETVFNAPLTMAVIALPEYTSQLHADGAIHTPERFNHYMNLAIPLSGVFDVTTVVAPSYS